MQNLDAKKMALMELRKKLRKIELDEELGLDSDGDMETEDALCDEKGTNNMLENSRETAEVLTSSEGEDGEKTLASDMGEESSGAGMDELYKKMKEDFNSEKPSRMASGKKKAVMGGIIAMAVKKRK